MNFRVVEATGAAIIGLIAATHPTRDMSIGHIDIPPAVIMRPLILVPPPALSHRTVDKIIAELLH